MLYPRLVVLIWIQALVVPMAFSPALRADREPDDKRLQREQSPRPSTRGARSEPREQRTGPDPSRQAVPARPISSVTTPGAPPPLPIKDWRKEPKTPREPPKAGWVLDTKFQHNHYYPPRGIVVEAPPAASRKIVHHNDHYYYHDGVWYLCQKSRCVVVLPPYGIVLPYLPPFYTTIWSGPYPYYYAGGVYYSWWPAYQQYAVVEPPPDEKVSTAGDGGPEPLYVYPAAGQSEEQQARDRYECHRWSQKETGFDPSAPGGDVPATQYANRRADYYRAMKACLEARHYSVQ